MSMPLIVIEGSDCSGKETQTGLLEKKLINMGQNVTKISFPDYGSESSYPVRMYLEGRMGGSAYDVNPYAASILFAVDRFTSYRLKWKDALEKSIVIADRYVTSNMVHQASKIEDEDEKLRFFEWASDLEYVKLGLPEPNLVLFLDMPPEISSRLNAERKNKATGLDEKDIHERDLEYLEKSYKNAHFAAENSGWKKIECAPKGALRSAEDISEEIFGLIKELL